MITPNCHEHHAEDRSAGLSMTDHGVFPGPQPGAVAMNWLANGLGVVIFLGVLGWFAGLI